jgi:serine/threonine protein phosphatase PrpC
VHGQFSAQVNDREVSGVKFVKSNLHGEHHPSEDAPPLAEDLGGGWFLLGAFDGLGGTGSDRYVRKHDGAERTGAYIASRVAARAVENAKRDLVRVAREAAAAPAPVAEAVASYLSECFQSSFRSALLELDKRPTMLRVRGALTLPTTVATVLGRASRGRTDLAVLWLGDSHIYCFRRGRGLQLLTTEEFDPASNVEDFFESALGPLGEYRDRGMAQALHAQEKQALRTAEHVFDDAVFMIAATDGVYDAFRSVLAFESALLEQVAQSRSVAVFEESFSSLVGRHRQDDATFAFLAIEDDWSNVQLAAQQRLAQLAPFRADPARTWAQYRAGLIAIPGRAGMAFAADAADGLLAASDGAASPRVPTLVLDQAPSQEILSRRGQSDGAQPSRHPDRMHSTRIPLPPEYSEVAHHQSLHDEEAPVVSDAAREPVPIGPLAKPKAGATQRRSWPISNGWTLRPRPGNTRTGTSAALTIWRNRRWPRGSTTALLLLVPLVLIALGTVLILWSDEKPPWKGQEREIASALQSLKLLPSGSRENQTEWLRALERYQALSTQFDRSRCSMELEKGKNSEIKPETVRNLMDDARLAPRVASQFAWYIPPSFAPNGWEVPSPQFVCNLWLLRRYLTARHSRGDWATQVARGEELSEARFLVHAVAPLTDVGLDPQRNLEALRERHNTAWLPGVTLTPDDLDWLRSAAKPVLEEVAAQLEMAGYQLVGGEKSWKAISSVVELFQRERRLSVDGLLRQPTRETLDIAAARGKEAVRIAELQAARKEIPTASRERLNAMRDQYPDLGPEIAERLGTVDNFDEDTRGKAEIAQARTVDRVRELQQRYTRLGKEAEKRIREITPDASPSADPPPSRTTSAGATIYLDAEKKAEARKMLVELGMIKDRDGGWANTASEALRQFRNQQKLDSGIGLPTEEDYANLKREHQKLQREKQRGLEEKVDKMLADPANRANIGRTLFRSGFLAAQDSDEDKLSAALNDFSRNLGQPPYEAINRLDEFLADRVKEASGELVRLRYLGRPGDGRWTVEFDQALNAFKRDHTALGEVGLWFRQSTLALSEELLNSLKTEVRLSSGPRFDDPATDKRYVEAAQFHLGIKPIGKWGPNSQEKLKAFLASQGLDSDGSLTLASVCAAVWCRLGP